MLTIRVNGKNLELNKTCSLTELIEKMNYQNVPFAVAVNQSFVARSEHSTYYLKDGDEVDIVMPMQGG